MASKKSRGGEDLFTYLNMILNKVRPGTPENKLPVNKTACNPFMLSMYLAHEKDLIGIVQEMNKIQFSLPEGREQIVFEYYFDKIPFGRRFIKWTKKTKTSKEREARINELVEELDVSELEADKILKVMEKCMSL
jgi:hypothetical protein